MTKGSGRPVMKGDHISFQMGKIAIGTAIAMFFFKQGASHVIIEYDFTNKSMIIEAVTPEKIKSGRCINGINISSVQPEKKRGSERWAFFILTVFHEKIIDMNIRNLEFKAIPIAKDKVIVKDIPMHLKNINNVNLIIDMYNNKITIHSIKTNNVQIQFPALTNTNKLIDRLSKRSSHSSI